MIATISPLVQEAPRQWRRSVVLHIAGSMAGGSLVFGPLAVIGRLTFAEVPTSVRWGVAGVITLTLALNDFGLVPLRLPMRSRSVPQTWWLELGPSRGAFAYGVVLGMGMTTIIPFGTFYVVAVWALLMANPSYGLTLGIAYGFARALPVLLASQALTSDTERGMPRKAIAKVIDRVDRGRGITRLVNAFAEAAFASALIATAVLALWP